VEKEGITGEALTEGREAQQLSLHPSQASKISQPSSPLTTVIKKENAQLGQTTTKGKKNGYCWVFNIFNFEIILDLLQFFKINTESSCILHTHLPLVLTTYITIVQLSNPGN